MEGRPQRRALAVKAVVEAVREGDSTAEEEVVVVVMLLLFPWLSCWDSLAGHRRMEGQSTVAGRKKGSMIVECVS